MAYFIYIYDKIEFYNLKTKYCAIDGQEAEEIKSFKVYFFCYTI